MAAQKRSSESQDRVRSDYSKAKLMNRSLDAELESKLQRIEQEQFLARRRFGEMTDSVADDTALSNLMEKLGLSVNRGANEDDTEKKSRALSAFGRNLRVYTTKKDKAGISIASVRRTKSAPPTAFEDDDDDEDEESIELPTAFKGEETDAESNSRLARLNRLARPRVPTLDLTRARINTTKKRYERFQRSARIEFLRGGHSMMLSGDALQHGTRKTRQSLIATPLYSHSDLLADSHSRKLDMLKVRNSATMRQIEKRIRSFCQSLNSNKASQFSTYY